MKKIPDRNSRGILSNLLKAREIIRRQEQDGEELVMDENIAKECENAIAGILYVINNTLH